MAWHQISAVSDPSLNSDLSNFFSDLGAISVTYINAKSPAVYEPNIGETRLWEQTKTIALFELEASPELIHHLFLQKFPDHPISSWHVEILADQIWERSWMEHYQPMKFGQRLWVYPTGQEKNTPDTVSLVLDPGLAFGTGTHPTTALCLEWLANNDVTGKIVIDFGCGSGILAIAAILLGAKEAYAVDIDPQALIATLDNAQKNQVEAKIKTFLVNDFKPFFADLVLANILAKPLIELSENISALVKTKGQLVLSGILKEQAIQVSQCYQTSFFLHAPTIQGDWCCLNGLKKQ
jgi:ribosomal protein L11 methyltransferase